MPISKWIKDHQLKSYVAYPIALLRAYGKGSIQSAAIAIGFGLGSLEHADLHGHISKLQRQDHQRSLLLGTHEAFSSTKIQSSALARNKTLAVTLNILSGVLGIASQVFRETIGHQPDSEWGLNSYEGICIAAALACNQTVTSWHKQLTEDIAAAEKDILTMKSPPDDDDAQPPRPQQ